MKFGKVIRKAVLVCADIEKEKKEKEAKETIQPNDETEKKESIDISRV